MTFLHKKFITAIVLLGSLFTHAQEFDHYIEENGKLKRVSETAFSKTADPKKYIDVYKETAGKKIAYLYLKKRIGKLDVEKFNALKSLLEEISEVAVNKDGYIVINYITAVPRITAADTPKSLEILKKGYTDRLKKETLGNAYFIYNENQHNTPAYYEKKHIKWLQDKDNLLLKMLFPAEGNYENLMVLRPDGTFIIYLGEYDTDLVFELINELKKIP